MRIEFNDIKHKFDISILDREQVLGPVSCGLITFGGYRKITDKNCKEPRKPKRPEKGTSEPVMHRIDRVATAIGRGPRGDHYDWRDLLENETLEFGNEQGNYCGGATLSYRFYGDRRTSYPYDHPVTMEYLREVARSLKYYKDTKDESKKGFYQKIVDMCKKNRAGSTLALIDKIGKGEV